MVSRNDKYFHTDSPVFYKNKVMKKNTKSPKYYYISALDWALSNNQTTAL